MTTFPIDELSSIINGPKPQSPVRSEKVSP